MSASQQIDIHQLVDSDSLSEVEELVRSDPAFIHERAEGGDSVLHTASSLVMVQLLLRYGADPNATNSSGQTPLHEAAVEGNVDKVAALVEGGAGTNRLSLARNSPLYEAARSKNPGCEGVAKFLLEHGAVLDVNSMVALRKEDELRKQLSFDPYALGRSPHPSALVSDAVNTGSAALVQLLLENGADPNATPVLAPPPLIIAMQMAASWDGDYLQIVHQLLTHGANPDVTWGPCGSALEWGTQLGSDAIMAELRAAVSSRSSRGCMDRPQEPRVRAAEPPEAP